MTHKVIETETEDSAVRCLSCLLPFGNGYVCAHCGVAPKNVPWNYPCLRPGTLLHNRYVIGRSLGQGGFAITYLALQEGLNRRVAVKEYYPSDLADRDKDNSTVQLRQTPGNPEEAAIYYRRGLERFLEEGQNIVQCHQPSPHPNLVRVTDYFEENGTAYLVMDYVEGISLEDHLKNQPSGRLEERQALDLVVPVLNGLSAVHHHGFMHRDVKPGNIYLSKEGTVILLDFGSARQSLGKEQHTLTVMLTPGYAPPEQYSSDGEQGPWTDIYGVAATLYRCITGETPPSAMARMAGTELQPPSAYPEIRINGRIEKALMNGLMLDRGERIQSAEDFMQAVKGRASDVLYDAAAIVGRLRDLRHLTKAFLILLVVVGVCGGILLSGYILWQRIQEKAVHDSAMRAQRQESEEAGRLYDAGVELVKAVTSSGDADTDSVGTMRNEVAAARSALNAGWAQAHGDVVYKEASEKWAAGEKSFKEGDYKTADTYYREAAERLVRLIMTEEAATAKPEAALAVIQKVVEAQKDAVGRLSGDLALPEEVNRGADLLNQARQEKDPVKQIGYYRQAWTIYNALLEKAANAPNEALEKLANNAESSKKMVEEAMARRGQGYVTMADPSVPSKQVELGGGVTMELVSIPAGEFMMGSAENEAQRQSDEGPEHLVRITHAFDMGRYEVTIAQFTRFVQATGYRTTAEYAGGAWTISESGKREWRRELNWRKLPSSRFSQSPVVVVSWEDAKAFCEWMSGLTGKAYRLPTEAEWEYACRAGTSTAYPWGDAEEGGDGWLNGADVSLQLRFPEWIAFPFDDGHLYVAKVGAFRGNAFGLHDMLGNVWEWCEDWYGADYYAASPKEDPQNTQTDRCRVVRGGSWLCYPGFCRSAVRFKYSPDCPNTDVGFRVISPQ